MPGFWGSAFSGVEPLLVRPFPLLCQPLLPVGLRAGGFGGFPAPSPWSMPSGLPAMAFPAQGIPTTPPEVCKLRVPPVDPSGGARHSRPSSAPRCPPPPFSWVWCPLTPSRPPSPLPSIWGRGRVLVGRSSSGASLPWVLCCSAAIPRAEFPRIPAGPGGLAGTFGG